MIVNLMKFGGAFVAHKIWKGARFTLFHRIASPSTWLLIFILCLAALLLSEHIKPTVLAQTPADPRFGVIEAFWAQEEAAELNVGWERILFYWRELQPNGPDDWNTLHVLEEWLGQANARGRTVVGLIKNTPPWATEAGSEAGIPKGLYLDIDDPENLWANFIRQVGTYYSVRNVHHWIIWNEPEIPAGVYGHEFSGTVRDYYRMLKIAYLVMNEVDSDAVIHLAGLTWWHDQEYLDRLLDLIVEDPDAEKNDFFFDTISLHIYFRSETIKTVTEEVQKLQSKHGLNKPIWINETNAPPNRDPEWPISRQQFEVDNEQQAWFIVQAHALGFAAGVESIGIYKLLDINLSTGEESFGLLRPDYSRRPAFQAYKTTIQYLSGFEDVSRQQAGDYFVITFRHPGKVTRVLWARTPSPVTVEVPALSENAHFIDVTGKETIVSPVDGAYVFTLKEATCYRECIIGGPPVFLVESVDIEDAHSVPTAMSLEDVSATPVAATTTPTFTPTKTRTPRPTRTVTPSPTPSSTPSPSHTSTSTLEPTLSPRIATDDIAQGEVDLGGETSLATSMIEGSTITERSTPKSSLQSEAKENDSNSFTWGLVLAVVVIIAIPIAISARRASS
jgi:hypothetical protein